MTEAEETDGADRADEAAELEPAPVVSDVDDDDQAVVDSLPTGPDVACLDAMALILFQIGDRVDVLTDLFEGTAVYVPDVVINREIAGVSGEYAQQNAELLSLPWLQPAPVLAGDDAALVSTLRFGMRNEASPSAGNASTAMS